VLAAERGAAGRRYVLCGATLTSAEAFAVLSRVSGREVRPRIVPAGVARAAGVVAEVSDRRKALVLLTRRGFGEEAIESAAAGLDEGR
jgi:hypothetical protein